MFLSFLFMIYRIFSLFSIIFMSGAVFAFAANDALDIDTSQLTEKEINNLISAPQMETFTSASGYQVTVGSLPDTPNLSVGTVVLPDNHSVQFSSRGDSFAEQSIVFTDGQTQFTVNCTPSGCSGDNEILVAVANEVYALQSKKMPALSTTDTQPVASAPSSFPVAWMLAIGVILIAGIAFFVFNKKDASRHR